MAAFVGGYCSGCACDVAVSVVVPVYNALPWLREQLHALSIQDTPTTWELVLSDNGSQDESMAVAEAYASKFHSLRIVDASGVRGPAHARNVGAAAARGKLLLFCDADDVADRFWLHAMLRASEAGRLLGGCLEYELLNSAQVRMWRDRLQDDQLSSFYDQPYVLTANLGVPRDLFVALNGFDESFSKAAGEDIDFALRALRNGAESFFVGPAIMHYRLRADYDEALQQASGYGRASATVIRRHADVINRPTVWHDLMTCLYLELARRHANLIGADDRNPRWRLRYHHTQLRSLITWPGYWRLRRAPTKVSPGVDPPPLPRRRLSRTRRRLKRVALEYLRRQLPEDCDSAARPDPWTYLAEIRASLVDEERYLLGAGLLADADVTLEARRGRNTFYLNPSMDFIVRSVIAAGSYSEGEIAAVDQYLRHATPRAPSARWIVNVGANVGTTAMGLAERDWRVLAIEPVPRAVELLRRNVEANGFKDMVSVVQSAVATSVGVLEMVVGENLSTSEVRGDQSLETLATPGDYASAILHVPASPLHRLLSRSGLSTDDVALVWSDTEGSEAGVIESAPGLWAAGVPLWVEIRPSALADQGSITRFCSLVAEHFDIFRTLDGLTIGQGRSTTLLRDFIDDIGYGRWDFTNVLLERGSPDQ